MLDARSVGDLKTEARNVFRIGQIYLKSDGLHPGDKGLIAGMGLHL